MSGGLTRPQGHPLGSCGTDMAMVWPSDGDMGTITNTKRDHVSWVTSTGQHKRSWWVPDVAGSTIGQDEHRLVTVASGHGHSIGHGRKIGHRCPPWVADMIGDMGSMAHMMADMGHGQGSTYRARRPPLYDLECLRQHPHLERRFTVSDCEDAQAPG